MRKVIDEFSQQQLVAGRFVVHHAFQHGGCAVNGVLEMSIHHTVGVVERDTLRFLTQISGEFGGSGSRGVGAHLGPPGKKGRDSCRRAVYNFIIT